MVIKAEAMTLDRWEPWEASLLLVDDDPGTIQLLRKMLDRYRHVRFATRGADAVRLAQESSPDLILLDFELPDANGIEIFSQLRAIPSLANTPVIFVTSRHDPAFESEVLNLGASDFIGKPPNALLVNARVKTQLRLKYLTDQLKYMAGCDGLTQIANRRFFDDHFEREWHRHIRQAAPLSLLFIDVDHFKRYNDALGHLAGDDALRAVANCLKSTVRRSSDIVARYGGEEFAVVLPESNQTAALKVAEEIRQAIEALEIPHVNSPIAGHVTVSIGVATMTPVSASEAAGQGRMALIQAADEALYQAKRAGRNRVVLWQLPAKAVAAREVGVESAAVAKKGAA